MIAPDALARLLADVAWWQGAPIFGPPEASRCIERAAPLPAPPVVTAPPATVAPPPVVLPSPPVVLPPPPVGAPRPVATGPGWAPPSTTVPPEAAPPEPGRISRLVKAVSSELAIHGLADLGVLLVFAGLFGFVAFAFGEVRVGLRPVAELAIPATFGGTGWFVRRRGTPLIGAALVFLGGALLPVVVIASTSDGAPFPPDLTGSMLVVGLTAALVLIAVGYVVVALRDPTTPLRFLAAPVLWLAVAVAGLGLGRAVPEGSALASPAALQWSLVCAAIALSVLAVRLVLPERWVAPVVVPAWAGLPIAYVLTLLAAHESGWSAPAVVVAGVAAIVGLELLAAGWRLDLVTGLQVTVLVVTAWEVSDLWGVGWAALAAGTVALAAAELRTRQRAPAAIAEALVWGSVLALGLTVVDVTATPWALVVGSAGAWCWALVRTHRPAVVSPTVTTALLWALPVGAALGLATATDVGTAQVVLAAALVVIAAGIRVRPAGVLPLWDRWVPAAGAALLL